METQEFTIKDNPKSTLGQDYKKGVRNALINYCNGYGSQNKASKSLKDVSPANITQIIKGNWELITDQYWRNLAAQIGYKEFAWPVVKTDTHDELHQIFDEAATYSENFTIIGPHGCGKTLACKEYAAKNAHVYHIHMVQFWGIDDFIKEIRRVLGLDKEGGYKRFATVEKIGQTLSSLPTPLLLLDEAHNMNGQIRSFLKTLVNITEGRCGIVRLGTVELENQIKADIKNQRHSGAEVNSRFPTIYHVKELTAKDVKAICLANGVEGAVITDITAKAQGDGRIVKRKILGEKRAEALEA